MRLVTYLHGDQSRLGVFLDGWVVDLKRAHHLGLVEVRTGTRPRVDPDSLSSMVSFLESGESALAAAREVGAAAQERFYGCPHLDIIYGDWVRKPAGKPWAA